MFLSQIEKVTFASLVRAPLCEFTRLLQPEIHHQASLPHLVFFEEHIYSCFYWHLSFCNLLALWVEKDPASLLLHWAEFLGGEQLRQWEARRIPGGQEIPVNTWWPGWNSIWYKIWYLSLIRCSTLHTFLMEMIPFHSNNNCSWVQRKIYICDSYYESGLQQGEERRESDWV